MLLSNTATVKWNSKNKRHYVDLGYAFTKMGDPFVVSVSDLTNGSTAIVNVMCDYCGKEYTIMWDKYTTLKSKTGDTDCCKDCCEIKAAEAISTKYGGYTEMYFAIDDKRRATNVERYGSENPFGSEQIKQKIFEANMRKYGAPSSQCNEAVRTKTVQTCLERYGVENYVELFKGKFIKENSPNWKGGVAYSRVERATYEYATWRRAVFERDLFTCQACGRRNGRGETVELHAHHVKNWCDNKDCRYDVDNGVTLCVACHSEFHSKYGKRNNTAEQLYEFLTYKIDEKVC